MTTTVVIHGSALATPATARDVDVIFVGDRDEALRAASAWATARGLGHLPLDLHGTDRATGVTVPRVPGAEAPFEVIAGDLPVERREYSGLASLIRAPLSAEAAHAAITAGWRVRFALGELTHPGDGSRDWTGYVDGRTALASAIHHARAEGRWDALAARHPALYRCLAAVAEHGAGKIPEVDLDVIRRGSPAPGAPCLDAFLTPQFGGDGLDRPLICATHAHEGAPCWRSFDALTRSIVEGAPCEKVPERYPARPFSMAPTDASRPRLPSPSPAPSPPTPPIAATQDHPHGDHRTRWCEHGPDYECYRCTQDATFGLTYGRMKPMSDEEFRTPFPRR